MEGTSGSSRYTFARSEVRDAWTHSGNLSEWAQVYEQLAPGEFHARLREAWLGGVQIIQEEVHQPFSYRGRPWEGARVFNVVSPGAGDLFYDGRRVQENVLMTHRWDGADRVLCNHALSCFGIAVDENLLAEYESVLREPWRSCRLSQPAVVSTGGAASRFVSMLHGMLQSLESEPEILTHESRRRAARKELVSGLIEMLAGASGSLRRLEPPKTRAYIVEQAIEFIETHVSEPIAISDVCKAVRTCPRTLRYSFQEVVGISPCQHLLAVRLNGAHRDLLERDPEKRVEDIAVRWGFWHLSRFSQKYRETFGELPSQTRGRPDAARQCNGRSRTYDAQIHCAA